MPASFYGSNSVWFKNIVKEFLLFGLICSLKPDLSLIAASFSICFVYKGKSNEGIKTQNKVLEESSSKRQVKAMGKGNFWKQKNTIA